MRIVLRVWVTAVLGALLAVPGHGQVTLGVQGGFNRTNLSGDAIDGTKFTSRRGYVVGAVVEFGLTSDVKLSLQPMWQQRGANIAFKVPAEEPNEPNDTEWRDSLDVTLGYLSLPILLKVTAISGRTYVTGGVNVGYLANATLSDGTTDDDISSVFLSYDVSAVFGFGVAFPIGRPQLTVEARYEQSITNVADPARDADGDPFPVRFRNTGLAFLAAVLIPLGDQ